MVVIFVVVFFLDEKIPLNPRDEEDDDAAGSNALDMLSARSLSRQEEKAQCLGVTNSNRLSHALKCLRSQ